MEFGTENVTVTLEWAKEAGVSYNVSVTPQVNVEYLDSTLVQVVVAYNVVYNVSIVSTLCGRYTAIIFNKLCYGELHNRHCLEGFLEDLWARDLCRIPSEARVQGY